MEPRDYKMINIEAMMEVLNMLWNKGVDYVDISGKQGEDQDEICFSFCREYMDEEYKDTFEDGFIQEEENEIISKPTQQIKVKLTDKDIDELI